MNGIRKAILRTLIYFEIFRHPLNADELYLLLGVPANRETFETELRELLAEQLVRQEAGYFFIYSGQVNINDRLNKQERARRHGRTARLISALISWHPYVRGVFITGSMSKKVLAKKDDIDFFVITEPGRLWLCRTFLMLFKKVILLNSKKYFCINYYLDSNSLEIPDRNLFTAMEVSYLKPVQNPRLYLQFVEANSWVKEYFPNRVFHPDGCPDRKDPWLKRMVEHMMNGKIGERLDDYLMKVYRSRSVRKYRIPEDPFFDLNFRSSKNVSKHHPDGYQEKVLNEYASRTTRFEKEHGFSLSTSS